MFFTRSLVRPSNVNCFRVITRRGYSRQQNEEFKALTQKQMSTMAWIATGVYTVVFGATIVFLEHIKFPSCLYERSTEKKNC